MADFQFSDQKLSDKLVESISNLLDAAGIPHLLWGNFLLAIYGVPTIVEGVSFIVPDTLIERAESIIGKSGFLPCPRPSECPHEVPLVSPRADAHRHIDDDLAISLFRKSEILLDFPDLESAFGNCSPDVMHASDERLPSYTIGRGQGRLRFKSSIRIPTTMMYTEAIITLICRDWHTRRQGYWVAMLTYIMEYVDGTDAMFNSEDLKDGYKEFYCAASRVDRTMWPILEELRRDLIDREVITLAEDAGDESW
ncbi:uncharacterized protein DSM5745_05076 [Aspergillus mulundensis]|uniref:Uncharacterized protein n=1 Tax=Aspergillus mulundensis TaxID=1810919 RepID=A0A3D8S5F8_9EURO|nr:hypothetical protein DSM5745_05076 [Aspergillus mulundensis]RDW81519.1 hypothetical protein DSM5745_05076 [Aspergillus mulundensis]